MLHQFVALILVSKIIFIIVQDRVV